MSKRAPLWGNFVYYADHDMLAFCLLAWGGLYLQAFYHGTQAIEKYLKALCLSIIDPLGTTDTPTTQPWIRTHDLVKLARRCEQKFPYYGQPEFIAHLERIAEFDQATRYPWVLRKYGNGFTGADIPIFEEITHRLRNDIPIIVDDYPLGMEVRGGYFHGDGNTPHPGWFHYPHAAIEALKQVFPSLNEFVRW